MINLVESVSGRIVFSQCDVVHVDTGTYHLLRNIVVTAQHSGVRIEGPGSATALLRRGRLPPGRLVIEVTEHAVAEDLAQVIGLLTALRDAGVRVALDDFGAGYSSLAHLRALPVDILKIDRQLLESEIIDVVVRFGQRLGLEVVAEGVTEADQLRVLEDAGCTYAQGLLLGRSMPAERVETLFGVQNLGSVDSAHEMRQS